MRMRSSRSGNYSVILGLVLPVFLGFTALSVDQSWIRIAQSQSQDVADAAAHAALVELRRTGDTSAAEAVAVSMIGRNQVGEAHGEMISVEFGGWNRGGAEMTASDKPNAVRVDVGRTGENELPLYFARIWNRDSAAVQGSATAASRSLHAVVVMDITASFRFDIHWARDGAVSFLDIVHDTASPDDRVGMVTFFSKYAHVWTEPFDLYDETEYATARAQWSTLTWGSTAHDYYGPETPAYPFYYYGADYYNDASQMPRYYGDDRGTDHSVGLKLGIDVLLEEGATDPFAYKALVVLTDGYPVGLPVKPARRPDDLVETWRVYMHGDDTRSESTIILESQNQALRAEDNDINVWTIAFGTGGQKEFMRSLVVGDGNSYATTDPSELEPIFVDIAVSLPMLLVK